MSDAKPLFQSRMFRDELDAREQRFKKLAQDVDDDALLVAGVEATLEELVGEVQIEIPSLTDDLATIELSINETTRPMPRYPDLDVRPGSPWPTEAVTQYAFSVPFAGDRGVFQCCPNYQGMVTPNALVTPLAVVFVYQRLDHDTKAAQADFEKHLEEARNILRTLARDQRNANGTLEQWGRERLTSRRAAMEKARQVDESFPYRIRRRDDAPSVTPPAVKRKAVARAVAPPKPKATTPPAHLPDEEYEFILHLVQNMVVVMERSPGAFAGMGEEDLRTHFLVQLNGQYEGQATGETFNYKGKTDILIRVEDSNIFVGECKMWKGTKELQAAVTQLLGYTTWQDTKTALLVFNRDRQMTTVLEAVPAAVKEHANFVRELDYAPANSFRFVMNHPDDDARRVTMTVLVFDVPNATA